MPRSNNKQKKLHIRKGDMIRVISVNDRGKEGKVLRVYPEKERVIVEGVNVRVRHTRPNQLYPQGGRIQQEMAIHASNVMPLDGNAILHVSVVRKSKMQKPDVRVGFVSQPRPAKN